MKINNRILIIDDDPGIRDAYRDILQPPPKKDILSMGAALFDEPEPPPIVAGEVYELTVTERGEHGVKAARESLDHDQPFAVAFIDMMMPGIDGAEAAHQIWECDPRIKIAIVTAYSEHTPDDIIRVTGRNDIFYLRKPFNPEEIRQLARALTNQWNLEQERESLAAQLKAANSELADMNCNLEKKVKEQTALLIQSEKMATIGILAAGVAHEINNPISFVNGNLSALKKYSVKIVETLVEYKDLEDRIIRGNCAGLPQRIAEIRQCKEAKKIDFILGDIGALVDESLEGVDRVRDIVRDLKTFSRIDEAEFKPIDINGSLDATLNILWNEIKYRAEVIKDYGEIPEVTCFPLKISQAFMNILVNAAQAIADEGKIRIETRLEKTGRRREDEKVAVIISDTGMGMPESSLSKIFDPFYTTKPVGQGTGLGLSITYDIIKAHGGTIHVQSEQGRGTTFTITLPVIPPGPRAIDPSPAERIAGPSGQEG